MPSSCCKDRVVKSGSIWLLRQNKLACNYLCSKSGGFDFSHEIGQYLWLKAVEESHKTWMTKSFDHDHHTGCVKVCLSKSSSSFLENPPNNKSAVCSAPSGTIQMLRLLLYVAQELSGVLWSPCIISPYSNVLYCAVICSAKCSASTKNTMQCIGVVGNPISKWIFVQCPHPARNAGACEASSPSVSSSSVATASSSSSSVSTVSSSSSSQPSAATPASSS